MGGSRDGSCKAWGRGIGCDLLHHLRDTYSNTLLLNNFDIMRYSPIPSMLSLLQNPTQGQFSHTARALSATIDCCFAALTAFPLPDVCPKGPTADYRIWRSCRQVNIVKLLVDELAHTVRLHLCSSAIIPSKGPPAHRAAMQRRVPLGGASYDVDGLHAQDEAMVVQPYVVTVHSYGDVIWPELLADVGPDAVADLGPENSKSKATHDNLWTWM